MILTLLNGSKVLYHLMMELRKSMEYYFPSDEETVFANLDDEDLELMDDDN